LVVDEKKVVVLVVPDDIVEVSVEAVNLCELFVSTVIESPEPVIELAVSDRDRHVGSNSAKLKNLISMYLGARKLEAFYRQLARFARTDEQGGCRFLKVIVDGVPIGITVKELRALPDLRLEISKSYGV
jgi:hypothetical protein